jgi:hypothetical protein
MNVNKVLTKDYENKSYWAICENEPKTNPIKANFRGKYMLPLLRINGKRINQQQRVWIYKAEVSIRKVLLELELSLISLKLRFRM